jgi:hypothetical protein
MVSPHITPVGLGPYDKQLNCRSKRLFSREKLKTQLVIGPSPIPALTCPDAAELGLPSIHSLRFDPVVYHHNYPIEFSALLDQVFGAIDARNIHSVSLGSFRLTRDHFRSASRLYPEEPLFAQNMTLENGIVSYPPRREREMIEFCEAELMRHIPRQAYHPCEWHD